MRMTRAEELSIDHVISEWLKAEWYKSYFDSEREKFSQVVLYPDILNPEENDIRKKLLESVRYDLIGPLYKLSVSWYCFTVSTQEEYANFFIVPVGNWYEISGRTFQVRDVPANLHFDVGHRADIVKKVDFLKDHKRFNERMIVVGSSENSLTVIEGNHRMAASLIHMQNNNIHEFPQKIIAGFSDHITKYRWSMEWEHIQDVLDLCKKEVESFKYES